MQEIMAVLKTAAFALTVAIAKADDLMPHEVVPSDFEALCKEEGSDSAPALFRWTQYNLGLKGTDTEDLSEVRSLSVRENFGPFEYSAAHDFNFRPAFDKYPSLYTFWITYSVGYKSGGIETNELWAVKIGIVDRQKDGKFQGYLVTQPTYYREQPTTVGTVIDPHPRAISDYQCMFSTLPYPPSDRLWYADKK